jgi:hypothetical protein
VESYSIGLELSRFLNKELKTEEENVEGIQPMTDFEAKCLGGQKMCIFQTKDEHDEGFSEVRRVYSQMKWKWFNGKDGIPWDFISQNEIWIYHPKFDGLIQVGTPSELADELKRVATSAVSWRSRSELAKGGDEI